MIQKKQKNWIVLVTAFWKDRSRSRSPLFIFVVDSKQKKLTSTFHRASICTIDLNLVFNLVSLMMGYLKRMSTEATQIVFFFTSCPKGRSRSFLFDTDFYFASTAGIQTAFPSH